MTMLTFYRFVAYTVAVLIILVFYPSPALPDESAYLEEEECVEGHCETETTDEFETDIPDETKFLKPICEVGRFYRQDDFFGKITNEFIYAQPDHFVPANIHCYGAILSLDFLSDKCACDCFYEHGASDSMTCAIDLRDLTRPPLGCVCLYTEEDKKRLPCLGYRLHTTVGNFSYGSSAQFEDKVENFQQWRQSEIVAEGKKRVKTYVESQVTKCQMKNKALEQYACMEEVCAKAYIDVKPAVCGTKIFTLPNSKTLDGVDICSLDCFYIHGSRKQPYGVCSRSTSHEERSICTCLY